MMKINGKTQVEIFSHMVSSQSVPWKCLDELSANELKSLWNDSKLKFHGTAEKYQNSYRFKELLDKCYETVKKLSMVHSRLSIILENIPTG